MKKSLFTLLAVSLGFAACQHMEPAVPEVVDDVLSAQIEQDEATKTVLSESSNILWSANDQIVAFMKTSYGHKYQIQPSFVGKTYANFSKISSVSGDDLSAGMEWDHNVAYYPYAEGIECLKSGDNYTLDVVLPAEQTYVAESFGNGTWPMVAVSEDNDITFKNVCGGMLLQLKGMQKVVSITVHGNNDEVLSGPATVTAYTDGETKPAITMTGTDAASKSVTLNCGTDGIQLNESTATEFVISLPPVLFSKGFTVSVIDSESNTYTVETDKANIVLRSSLLAMPPVKIDKEGAAPEEGDGDDDDELVIPIEQFSLTSYMKMYPSQSKKIPIESYSPTDATEFDFLWSSDNPTVAVVDQTGVVTAIADGTVNITAISGTAQSTCIINVIKLGTATVEYIDEYGDNHGYGIVLGEQVWAPVNCGYHKTDFPYGKLYQWGRKYGQGLGEPYDSGEIEFAEGGVSLVGGQHKSNANKFYKTYDYNWLSITDDTLWNSGTEESPKKGTYDPCPDGWRVPTAKELQDLVANYSDFVTLDNNMQGKYFSGIYEYAETANRIFLPASGYRHRSFGTVDYVGEDGVYWSASPRDNDSNCAIYLSFSRWGSGAVIPPKSFSYYRANGLSVRCIQE